MLGARLLTVAGICRRRRLSSVTLAYATLLTRGQHDGGPVVLRPVRATMCFKSNGSSVTDYTEMDINYPKRTLTDVRYRKIRSCRLISVFCVHWCNHMIIKHNFDTITSDLE